MSWEEERDEQTMFDEAIDRRRLAKFAAWGVMMAAATGIDEAAWDQIPGQIYSLVPLEILGDMKMAEGRILAVRLVGPKFYLVDQDIYNAEFERQQI